MKRLLIAIPIILLFLASGCVTGQPTKDLPQVNVSTGPAYKYNPTEYLSDWELVVENQRIGVFPPELQEELKRFDIVDAAAWEYQRGSEHLYIWSKVYETRDERKNATGDFTTPFAWTQRTVLLFGDFGAVGLYRNPHGEVPLLLYLGVNEADFIHIAYYNEDSAYNPKNVYDDETFLVGIAKYMINK